VRGTDDGSRRRVTASEGGEQFATPLFTAQDAIDIAEGRKWEAVVGVTNRRTQVVFEFRWRYRTWFV